MTPRTVLVCETQVPLVRGGAELLVQQLVDELRRRGVATDKIVKALREQFPLAGESSEFSL